VKSKSEVAHSLDAKTPDRRNAIRSTESTDRKLFQSSLQLQRIRASISSCNLDVSSTHLLSNDAGEEVQLSLEVTFKAGILMTDLLGNDAGEEVQLSLEVTFKAGILMTDDRSTQQ